MSRHPNVCHGKPVIRGTRTPVAIVVGSLAGGMSFEEVQHEYDLTTEDIREALKLASELVDQRFAPSQFGPKPNEL